MLIFILVLFFYKGELFWNEQLAEYRWTLGVSKMSFKDSDGILMMLSSYWIDVPSGYHHRYIYNRSLLYDFLVDSDSL